MSRQPHSTEPPAVLLVGHGTRSAIGREQFLHLARLVAGQLGQPVEPVFLEMAEPTIAEGVRRLVEGGAQRLVVAPAMLFSAGHVQRDIPAAVEAALAACGASVEVAYASHFGRHPLLVELARRRLEEALARFDAADPRQVEAIFVARGSRDDTATAEMRRLASQLAEKAGVEHFQVAFMAMARPPVEEALRLASQGERRQVVVHPHFLFHGDLVERLRALVASFASQTPGWDWQIGGILAQDLMEGGIAAELLPRLVVEGIDRARGDIQS